MKIFEEEFNRFYVEQRRKGNIYPSKNETIMYFKDWQPPKEKEKEQVKVPYFIDEYIRKFSESNCFHSLKNLLSHDEYYTFQGIDQRVSDYLSENIENQNLVARAWLDGYEIEKEKKYIVKLDSIKTPEYLKRNTNGSCYFTVITGEVLDDLYKFTESEIKAIDERFLAFAVEVVDD